MEAEGDVRVPRLYSRGQPRGTVCRCLLTPSVYTHVDMIRNFNTSLFCVKLCHISYLSAFSVFCFVNSLFFVLFVCFSRYFLFMFVFSFFQRYFCILCFSMFFVVLNFCRWKPPSTILTTLGSTATSAAWVRGQT